MRNSKEILDKLPYLVSSSLKVFNIFSALFSTSFASNKSTSLFFVKLKNFVYSSLKLLINLVKPLFLLKSLLI